MSQGCSERRIRRALAQSVSDPRLLKNKTSTINININIKNCFNTFCFNLCFSFQQSTIFNNTFSSSQQSGQFSAPILSSSSFFCKNFEQCFNCCSNNCFLFEQCAREAGCQGGSWHVNRVLFDSGWASFFEAVFTTPFFTKKSHFYAKMTPK